MNSQNTLYYSNQKLFSIVCLTCLIILHVILYDSDNSPLRQTENKCDRYLQTAKEHFTFRSDFLYWLSCYQFFNIRTSP
jgi:hypothetical protein